MNGLAARLAPLGVTLVVRPISPGDEAAFPDLTEPLERRRASGAARLAARAALASVGGPADAALPRSPQRYPLWPPGFVGSLAHDLSPTGWNREASPPPLWGRVREGGSRILKARWFSPPPHPSPIKGEGAWTATHGLAVAAVARASDVQALGVDVEPAAPLPDDVAGIALFGAERADPTRSRLIFAAKEAVYKAINPLDGTPLEYEDIAVDLAANQARLRDGRRLRLEWSAGERWLIVALFGAR